MAKYCVKKINTNKVKTVDGYWKAQREATENFFDSMKEVREFCGGKLYKYHGGWCGFDGIYDYICTRL